MWISHQQKIVYGKPCEMANCLLLCFKFKLKPVYTKWLKSKSDICSFLLSIVMMATLERGKNAGYLFLRYHPRTFHIKLVQISLVDSSVIIFKLWQKTCLICIFRAYHTNKIFYGKPVKGAGMWIHFFYLIPSKDL